MAEARYSRRAVFAAACLGMLVFGIVLTTLGAILPSIIARFEVDKVQAGSLLLLMSLGVLVGSLVFGPVVDRYGFKSMLIASTAAILAGIEGVAFADNFGLLRAAVFVAGFAGGIINGGTNALVADISSEGRSAGLSLLGVFFGIGAFGVPFTLSILIGHFSYSQIMAGVGATVIVPLVFFAGVRFPPPKQPRGFPLRQGMSIIRDPALLLVGFMLFLQSGIEITTSGWSATYFAEELEVDAGRAALLLSFFWVGLTLGRWVLGTWLRKADPFRVLLVSFGIGVAGSLLMLVSTGPVMAAAGIFIAGAGFAACFPYLLGFVGDLFPEISGTAFGIALVMALIGGSIFPYVIGFLGEWLGLRASFILIPASLIIMTFLLLAVRKRLTAAQLADD